MSSLIGNKQTKQTDRKTDSMKTIKNIKATITSLIDDLCYVNDKRKSATAKLEKEAKSKTALLTAAATDFLAVKEGGKFKFSRKDLVEFMKGVNAGFANRLSNVTLEGVASDAMKANDRRESKAGRPAKTEGSDAVEKLVKDALALTPHKRLEEAAALLLRAYRSIKGKK